VSPGELITLRCDRVRLVHEVANNWGTCVAVSSRVVLVGQVVGDKARNRFRRCQLWAGLLRGPSEQRPPPAQMEGFPATGCGLQFVVVVRYVGVGVNM